MKPKTQHIPGIPNTSEPPKALIQLSKHIEHPLVRRCGISCTTDGQWALYVTVPKIATVPIATLESLCCGFPVVYEAEPDEPLQSQFNP